MTIAASGLGELVAYCVWALEVPAVHGVPWRLLTIIPFSACLLRYWSLLRAGDGEAPEDLLLGDRPLVLAGFVWLLLFALEVHAAS